MKRIKISIEKFSFGKFYIKILIFLKQCSNVLNKI